MVEIEVKELLTSYGFDGDNCPFVCGSALLALKGDTSKYGTPSIQALLDAMDSYIPTPERDTKSPFLLPIDNIFSARGRGTIAVGTLKRGIITKSAPADLIGFGELIPTTITDIQIFQETITSAVAGQNVGVLLRGVKMEHTRRGMIVCKSKSLKLSNHFEAQIYLLTAEEGGRAKPLPQSGYSTVIYSTTWNIYCRFDFLLPGETKMLMPGEHTTTRLTLLLPMPVVDGQVFTVRENKQTIATGRITKTMDKIEINRGRLDLVKVDLTGKS